MKLPLRYTVPGRHSTTANIKICDATGRVVCMVPRNEWRLADLIVCRVNHQPFWHRIFGPPRDQRQKDYDKWIATSSDGFDFARANLEYMEHKAGRK